MHHAQQACCDGGRAQTAVMRSSALTLWQVQTINYRCTHWHGRSLHHSCCFLARSCRGCLCRRARRPASAALNPAVATAAACSAVERGHIPGHVLLQLRLPQWHRARAAVLHRQLLRRHPLQQRLCRRLALLFGEQAELLAGAPRDDRGQDLRRSRRRTPGEQQSRRAQHSRQATRESRSHMARRLFGSGSLGP